MQLVVARLSGVAGPELAAHSECEIPRMPRIEELAAAERVGP